MAVTVLNFYEADRRTAVADATMAVGDVVKIVVGASDGQRHVTKLGDTDDALALTGNIGVVYKVMGTEDSVQSSTASAVTGDRTSSSIAIGELVVVLRTHAIVEYNFPADVDASLTTPTVGLTLGVAGSKFATVAAATTSGVTSPVIGRVYSVTGTKVAIEIVL